ncbi:hypothetical protein L1987_12678 [Smallanthus sonchifolius]|uniref:Uncharacterized protein n=1 Tax=Smallanthus sonchifolius TaxID=185202 RepID=A0ACB9JES5_9ASTR|nr:hypothetical protein L1987_12678 [Smallanthus sonchifolius]
MDSCQSLLHVPVHVDGLNVLLYESYINVLRKGFVLEWKCSNCEELGKNKNWKLKLGIGLGSAGFAVLVMGVAFCLWRRRHNKKRYFGSSYRSRNISSYTSSMTDPEKNGTYHGVQIFKYRELEKATNHFDYRNELGDGGFGTVYQGKLKDGRVVAVKLELISSKPAVDITRHRHEINLSSMALNKIQNDALHELVDPHLGYETEYEVRKMINAVAELAFQCLQNERDCRPSMDEVLESLVGIQNGMCSKDKQDVLDDDAVLLKNYSQKMSPDSVAVAWSTSTMSISSG